MVLKMVSILFTLTIIFAMVGQTSTGPITGFACYWTCMAACTAGAGFFGGLMSVGVGTAPSIIYGAAACATTCGCGGYALIFLPTP